MFHLPRPYQHWHLQLRLVPSLLTLLLLFTFVQLGCWQLRRAAEKEALALKLQTGTSQINSLPTILGMPEADRRYQVIQLRGRFIGSTQLLLDNQMHEKMAGYRIFSLFHPEDSEKLMLIDRGWIPLGEDRRNLPSSSMLTSVPKNTIEIKGRLDYPNQGLMLRDADLLEPMGDFLRVQAIDFSLLSNFFKTPLYPFIVKLEDTSPYAFEASTPQISMPATKHLGYALQWFTMALVTLIYFGIMSLKRTAK